MTQPLPPAVRGERLPAALAAAERAVQPGDAKALLVIVDDLLAYCDRYGLKLDDVDGASRDFVAALRGLPTDLAALAVQRLKARWRWRNLPTPGDLLALVADDMAQRTLDLLRLQTAARRRHDAERPRGEPPRPETIQRLNAALRGMGRRVAEAQADEPEPMTDAAVAARKAELLAQMQDAAE